MWVEDPGVFYCSAGLRGACVESDRRHVVWLLTVTE